MRRRTKRIIGRLAVAVFLFVLAVVGLVAYTFLGRSAVVDGAESGGVRIVKDGIDAEHFHARRIPRSAGRFKPAC